MVKKRFFVGILPVCRDTSTALAQDHFYSDSSCTRNSLQNTLQPLMMMTHLVTVEIASLHDEGK